MSLVIFAILRIAPGDVAMMIALEMTGGEEDLVTEEQLARIREDVGLNAPIHMQYLTWIGGWVTGDWGESMFSNEGIWENFLRKLPVTVELALLSIALSTILGLPAGVLMAIRKDTWIELHTEDLVSVRPLDTQLLARHHAADHWYVRI